MLLHRLFVSAIFSVFLLSVASVFAQSPGANGTSFWWSPPDKSFIVRVPFQLELAGGFPSADLPAYSKIETFGYESSDTTILIQILSLGRDRVLMTPKEKFKGLQFVVGGDDDHDFTETWGKVDGLPSKSIVYSKQNHRGLFIDAGNKIIILALVTKDRSALKSKAAETFFSSFCLRRSRSHRRHND